jgi:hypothetical protein
MIRDTAASGEPKLGQNKAAANWRSPDCEGGYGAACRYFFFFDEDFLRGTLAPARRAWDNPMAIACFRLFTFFPDRPLFRVPFFRSRIAFATFSEAFFPYLAITESPRVVSPIPEDVEAPIVPIMVRNRGFQTSA